MANPIASIANPKAGAGATHRPASARRPRARAPCSPSRRTGGGGRVGTPPRPPTLPPRAHRRGLLSNLTQIRWDFFGGGKSSAKMGENTTNNVK